MGFDMPFDWQGKAWKEVPPARRSAWFPLRTRWEWLASASGCNVLGILVFFLLLPGGFGRVGPNPPAGSASPASPDTLRTSTASGPASCLLPVHRIQALTVSAGPLQRRAGRVRCG
jgi:hypothetical protein